MCADAPRLLIVDDIAEYLDSLSAALRGEWSVVTAISYETAVSAIRELGCDIALVDVRLSESDPLNRDGLRLLQWMQQHVVGVPVVVMSAYRDFETVVEALNSGARKYIKKPVDLRELKKTLKEVYGEHSPG